MSSQGGSILTRAWHRWKALRLPWRRRFLVGADLYGNTFWEFRDRGSSDAQRWRRIVEYGRRTHLDAVRVSPAWHQWLRHTRAEAPSLQEQQGDVVRQAQLKVLAAQADARWEAKARLVGGPAQGDGLGKVDAKLFGAAQPVTDPGEKDPRKDDMKGTEKAKPGDQEQEQVQDPGKRARGGPSEEWQPQAWNPASTTKR